MNVNDVKIYNMNITCLETNNYEAHMFGCNISTVSEGHHFYGRYVKQLPSCQKIVHKRVRVSTPPPVKYFVEKRLTCSNISWYFVYSSAYVSSYAVHSLGIFLICLRSCYLGKPCEVQHLLKHKATVKC